MLNRTIVTAKELHETVKFCVKHNFPILVKGKLGSGKSQICAAAAAEIVGRQNVVIEAPHMKDVPDYTGLAFAYTDQDGKQRADFLPINTIERMVQAEKPTTFIFDELDKAKLTMNAIAQIICERKISNRRIPDHISFVATCNLPEEQTGSFIIRPHLLDRFYSVIELKPSEEEWAQYMLKKYKEKAINIVQFIRMKPEYITKGQDTELALSLEKTSTARSLENYLKMEIELGNEKHQSQEELESKVEGLDPLFAGACGEAFHVEYQAFKSLFRDLPSFSEIVEDPLNTVIPDGSNQISLRFAIIGMLSQKITASTINPVCVYLHRKEWDQFASLRRVFIENIKATNSKLLQNPKFTEWLVKLA